MKKFDFSKALQVLREGGLIIYPTDTLYALGADIYNEAAVRNVFDTKKRPHTIPLPVAVASISAIETIAYMNPTAYIISKRFLPGTLTIILKKKSAVPQIVTSHQDTVAIRIPNNLVALELISKFGPLTATSANLHHEKTLGVINDIRMQLGTPNILGLDNGRLSGLPSTMIDLSVSPPQIVRKGSITEAELFDVIAHG
jgi:L-threonylcarbamoyladenylate synthase